MDKAVDRVEKIPEELRDTVYLLLGKLWLVYFQIIGFAKIQDDKKLKKFLLESWNNGSYIVQANSCILTKFFLSKKIISTKEFKSPETKDLLSIVVKLCKKTLEQGQNTVEIPDSSLLESLKRVNPLVKSESERKILKLKKYTKHVGKLYKELKGTGNGDALNKEFLELFTKLID